MAIKIENIQRKHKQGIHLLLKKLNKVDNLGYSLTDQWLDHVIKRTSESIFVAVDKKEILGLATCMVNEVDDTHAVINVVVDPDYRNQGIGTKLYNTVFTYTESNNIKELETYVKKRIEHATKFADNKGFSPLLYAWEMELEVEKAKCDRENTNNKDLTFRQATLKDNEIYADIINRVFGDPLTSSVLGQLLQDTSVRVYILEEEGQTVGSITTQIRGDLSLGYIYDVAVLEQYRQQGLGSYMLLEAIEKLKAENIATVSLTVTGQNEKALGLYRKLGFKETDIDIIMGKSV